VARGDIGGVVSSGHLQTKRTAVTVLPVIGPEFSLLLRKTLKRTGQYSNEHSIACLPDSTMANILQYLINLLLLFIAKVFYSK
jgi:hypothetical protein